jgi:hypothetical protein
MRRAGFLSVVAGTVHGMKVAVAVELIFEINKTVIVASSWCSVLLYLLKLTYTVKE